MLALSDLALLGGVVWWARGLDLRVNRLRERVEALESLEQERTNDD